jgi:hypothetical protein
VQALAAILERQAMPREDALAMAERSPFANTAHEVTAVLRRYRDAGLNAAMFDWPAPFDRQTLEAMAGLTD